MVTGAAFQTLAGQARRLYTEELVKGLAGLVQEACETSKRLLDKPAEQGGLQRRKEAFQSLNMHAQAWHRAIVSGLRHALTPGRPNALIEIRQDLIAEEAGQRAWADRLAPLLEAARIRANL